MPFTYHLATRTTSPCYYVRITGTAAAPVIEAQVAIEASGGAHGIFSTDGGATLWVVGTQTLMTCHRSVDDGATWEDKQTDVYRPAAHVPQCWCVGGFQDDPSVCLSSAPSFGGAGWCKLNETNQLFELKQAAGDRTYSIWADEFTGIMYAIDGFYPATFSRLWYSSDRGASWTADATVPFLDFAAAQDVVTDPRNGRIYIAAPSGFPDPTGVTVFRSEAVGGPWTKEFILVGTLQQGYGRELCCDETGAVWLRVLNGGTGHQVYRRDPGTGTWALSLQGTTGACGCLWVIDSENVLASIAGRLHFYDGTIWHSYQTLTDLGLGFIGEFNGMWAPNPPSIASVVGPVSTKGGELLTAVLSNAAGLAGLPMAAYFGPLGTTADPGCYFGQGLGYTGASADGLTVQVTAPPTAKTAAAKLTIVVDGNTLVSPAINVVERNWPGALHQMRRNFSPWAAMGARRLDSEDLE